MAEETAIATEEAPQGVPETNQDGTPNGEFWKSKSRMWEARAKENAKAAKENSDAAKELAALKEAEKTDLQRAVERAEKAEAMVATFEAAARRSELVAKVAASNGLPQQLVSTLAGDDEETLSVSAELWAQAISQARPPVMPSVPADRSAGTGPTNGKSQIFADWIRQVSR